MIGIYLKLFENVLGITKYKNELELLKKKLEFLESENNNLSSNLFSCNKEKNELLKEIKELSNRIQESDKITTADKDKIKELTSKVNELMFKLDNQSTISLYKKGVPVLLEECDPKNVYLGEFWIQTSKGILNMVHPSHPSIFFPCPIYEQDLNSAGVNMKRTDLTPVEICQKIANVAQKYMKYEYDKDMWYGKTDNWTLAPLTKLLKKDDCEGSSINILSSIFYYQLKFGAFEGYSVFLGCGNFNSTGHAFVVIIKDDSYDLKDSYIIEATSTNPTKPVSLDKAKSSYSLWMGITGFLRDSYKFGTYTFKPEYQWWKESYGTAGNSSKNRSIFDIVKEKLRLKKSPDQKKKEELDEFWKEYEV